MFSVIFSAIFALFAGVALLIGALKGKKYQWQLSVARIIVTILSAVGAALLASLISNAIFGTVLSVITNNGTLSNPNGVDIGGILKDIPSLPTVVRSLGAMILSPCLFIPIFLILIGVFNFLTKIIALGFSKKFASKKPETLTRKNVSKKYSSLVANYPNFIGGLLGAICSLFIFCILVSPLVCGLETFGGAVSVAADSIPDSAETGSVQSVALSAIRGSTDNLAVTTVKLTGGKFLYGMMTTGMIEGEMTNLNREQRVFVDIGKSFASVITSGNETDKEKAAARVAESVRAISDSFNDSVAVRIMTADFCVHAGKVWEQGESYYGIKYPKFKTELQPIADALIQIFSTSDKDTIKEDVRVITDSLAIMIERNLITDLGTNPSGILADESTTEELLKAFYSDKRLDPLVDGLVDFGITSLMTGIKAPKTKELLFDKFVRDFDAVNGTDELSLTKAYYTVFDNYGIRTKETGIAQHAASAHISGADMRSWLRYNIAADAEEFAAKTSIVSIEMITSGVEDITDRDHEAKTLAHALSVVSKLNGTIVSKGFSAENMLSSMGPALDSFSETETIGPEKSKYILEALLQSELIHNQLGLSVIEATDTAASIAENSSVTGYTPVMTSLAGVVRMLEAAKDKTANTQDAVNDMLANLTPEAANVMQIMATPGVMRNYGIPEKSADSTAAMISSTFANLKDVPSDEYDKESGAVTDMMNIMMSLSNANSDSETVFGGEGSTTGITEEEYVNNITGSKAMSKTVVDTAYDENGELKMNPLNSGRNLSDSERENLVSSLNDKWNSSEKDENTRKELTAIAAMMNVRVNITDDAVEQATSEAEPE